MLTDIFARRYEQPRMWETFLEEHRRLLVQGSELLSDLCPYYADGKENVGGVKFWTEIQRLLARELGLKELSPEYWGFYNKLNQWQSGRYTTFKMCETWMLQQFDGTVSADRFIKERLSLVELGFRQRENEVTDHNKNLPQYVAEAEAYDSANSPLSIKVSGKRVKQMRAWNETLNTTFQSVVNELNTRFRQANCPLHYHNGFIQISQDQTVAQEIETPFWKLIAHPKWQNVDHDMKEAIDLRDTGGINPAFYAARSLESTIKIICDEKQLTTRKEKGAHNYIDNLMGAKLRGLGNGGAETLLYEGSQSFWTWARRGPYAKPH